MALPKKKGRRSSQIGRLGLECTFLTYDDTANHITYTIKLNCAANQTAWNISKRYNDFYRLNNELQKDKNFRGIKLPNFPGKAISFTDASKKELAEERMQHLEGYLNGLISRTVFLSSVAVRAFLNMPVPVRDLAVILSTRQNAALKQGYMEKKGELNKKWRKRWFVLQPNYILKYYKEESSHDPQGSIDISTIKSVQMKNANTDKKYSFALVGSNRRWFLSCDNETEKREWTRMFMRLRDTKAPLKDDKYNQNNPNSSNANIHRKSLNLGPHFKTVTQVTWCPTIPGILATGSQDESVKIWQTHLLDHTLIPAEYEDDDIDKMLMVNDDNDNDDNNNSTSNVNDNNAANINNNNNNDNANNDDNDDDGDDDDDDDNNANNNNNNNDNVKNSTYPLHAIEFQPIAEYKTSGQVTCLEWSPDGSMLVASLRKEIDNNNNNNNNISTNNNSPKYGYFIQCFDLHPILGPYASDWDDFGGDGNDFIDDDNMNNGNNTNNGNNDDDGSRTKIFTLQDHPSRLVFSHDGSFIYMAMDIDPNSEENEKRRPAFLVYLDLQQNQLHRCKTVDRIIDHQTEFIVGLAMNNARNVMVVATSTHQGKGRILAWDTDRNETRIVERKGTRVSSMLFTDDDSWLIIGRNNGKLQFWNVYNENNKKLQNYYKIQQKNNKKKNQKNDKNNLNPVNATAVINATNPLNQQDQQQLNQSTASASTASTAITQQQQQPTTTTDMSSIAVTTTSSSPNGTTTISLFELKYIETIHSGPVFNLTTSNGVLISSAKPNNLDYHSFFIDNIIWDLRQLMNHGKRGKLITRLHNVNDNEKDITRLLDLSPVTPRHVREGGGPGTLLAASGDHAVYCHNMMDVLLDALSFGNLN